MILDRTTNKNRQNYNQQVDTWRNVG